MHKQSTKAKSIETIYRLPNFRAEINTILGVINKVELTLNSMSADVSGVWEKERELNEDQMKGEVKKKGCSTTLGHKVESTWIRGRKLGQAADRFLDWPEFLKREIKKLKTFWSFGLTKHEKIA